jgi:hypothetical protein
MPLTPHLHALARISQDLLNWLFDRVEITRSSHEPQSQRSDVRQHQWLHVIAMFTLFGFCVEKLRPTCHKKQHAP